MTKQKMVEVVTTIKTEGGQITKTQEIRTLDKDQNPGAARVIITE